MKEGRSRRFVASFFFKWKTARRRFVRRQAALTGWRDRAKHQREPWRQLTGWRVLLGRGGAAARRASVCARAQGAEAVMEGDVT